MENALQKAAIQRESEQDSGKVITIRRLTKNNLRLITRSAGLAGVSPQQQQRQYLQTLFGGCKAGCIEIRPIPADPRDRQWLTVSTRHIKNIPQGKNIYIGVATCKHGEGGKNAVVEIPAVWVDVDFKDTSEAEAQKILAGFSLKPSIHVQSGNGWHLYWLLKTPAVSRDIPKIEAINRKLAEHFAGDIKACDASRILRLPGTYNVKYTPHRFVRLLRSDPTKAYQFSDFDFLPPPTPPPPPAIVAQQPSVLYSVAKGERNFRTTQLAGHFLRKNLPISEIYEILRLWNRTNRPPYPDMELIRTIDGIHKSHMAKQPSAADSHDDIEVALEYGGIDFSKLITLDIPPIEYLVKPWLCEGDIAMISAQRGIGKTWLALSIGMAVTHDLPIGNWKAEKYVGCVYIDGEMAIQRLKARYSELLNCQYQQKAPFRLYSANFMRSSNKSLDLASFATGPFKTPNLADSAWREKISTHLANHPEYKLLILDNLASLTPGVDENPRFEWDPINQWLLFLRSQGLSVIMIHHAGKKGDQRGTSAHEDNIDVSIQLKRPGGYQSEDGAKFNVEFSKTREFYGEDAKTICLKLKKTAQGLVWEAATQQDTKSAKIIALINARFQQNEIAKIVGCKPPYVTKVKQSAIEAGFLDNDEKFTDKGEEEYGDIDTTRLLTE